MNPSKAVEIHEAWGIVYDQEKRLPNLYLTEEKGTFWLSRRGKVFQKNNATFIRNIRNQKIFKIRQKKENGERDITITIQPEDATDVGLVVNGKELHQKIEIGNGRCEITLTSLNINLIFEAFCDVSGNELLSPLAPGYRFVNLLGSGGFANVHKALSIADEEFCAVKTARRSEIDPELEREYWLIGKSEHEHVIKVKAFRKESPGVEYLITELADGGSLDYRIKHQGKLDERFAKRIFKQLFSAFDHIHSLGIIHRDLKPANIVLTSRDDSTCSAKVIDFGLACLVSEDDEMRYIVGSMEYMSPEILSKKLKGSDRPYTDKVDVWGLGVCLFVAVTNHKPFIFTRDLKEYRNRMQQGRENYNQLEYFTDLQPTTQKLLDHCLHIKAEKRPDMNQVKRFAWVLN